MNLQNGTAKKNKTVLIVIIFTINKNIFHTLSVQLTTIYGQLA